jgi:hypothetical protein
MWRRKASTKIVNFVLLKVEVALGQVQTWYKVFMCKTFKNSCCDTIKLKLNTLSSRIGKTHPHHNGKFYDPLCKGSAPMAGTISVHVYNLFFQMSILLFNWALLPCLLLFTQFIFGKCLLCLFIQLSVDGTYYGTVVSVCLFICPFSHQGFLLTLSFLFHISYYNLISYPLRFKIKFVIALNLL